MKRFAVLTLVVLVAAGILKSQHHTKLEPAITAEEIQEHINYLASDKLEGRFTGSKGCRMAGNYIEEEFLLYGLKPAFGDSYFQPFPFVAERKLTENNRLQVTLADTEHPLALRKDFIPFTFSDNLDFSGEVVFAGYGISAPKLNYDDYAGLDVQGKIVLVLRSHPEGDHRRSKFERYAEDRLKATVARDKGARAIILANGVIPARKEDRLQPFRYDRSGPVKGIAVLQITRPWLEKILAATGKPLAELQKQINTEKKPASFMLPNVSISGQVDIREIKGTGRNVAGILYGNDPVLKNQYVVIGAHYDHLGWGKVGSLYRGKTPQIHNGADDNASGTAGLLELAEKFSSVKDRLKRSIVFVAFSGEELGSIGATYFVKHSPVPLEQIVAMINMDMIGRMRPDSSLIVYGTGTSSHWKDLLNQENKRFGFHLTFHDEGYGPSESCDLLRPENPGALFLYRHPRRLPSADGRCRQNQLTSRSGRCAVCVPDCHRHRYPDLETQLHRGSPARSGRPQEFPGICGNHTGFFREHQRLQNFGCFGKQPGRTRRAAGRRHYRGIWRKAYFQYLRFHLRTTGLRTRGYGGSSVPPQRGKKACET